MKQLLSLLLLTTFVLGSGFVSTPSYAEGEQSSEKCEGEDCPKEVEAEPECD